MREGYEGGVRGRMCSYGASSEACVIIALAIFRSRGLSGDDVSVSVEKSNHASSQAIYYVSKVFIQL